VTAVTVRPTHRRRGIFGRLAATEHAAARDRGEIAAILFAIEYPIYGRLGYGPATSTVTWSVDLRATGFVDGPPDTGSVELVAADEAAMATARDLYERWRIRQPGETWRRPITWRDDFGLAGDVWGNRWKGFVALHRDHEGAVDGYVRYRGEEHWVERQPRHVLVVNDLHGLSEAVEEALWRYLAAIDLVATIRAERRSIGDRLPWLLTNRRAALPADLGDGIWVKLLDVAAALEARTYESSGSIVLEVVDADGRGEDGLPIERRRRVLLDAGPDGARARETQRSPELTLSAGALGAAYLGGTRLSQAVLAGGFDEHRPGALAEADRLFATLDPPWCSSFF
jgi:predicted acetyltransferase